MAVLVDTNIYIYARDSRYTVREKFAQHEGDILLSAVSLAELRRGFDARQPDAQLRAERHRLLIERVMVMPFDSAAAQAYADVLRHKGRQKARDFDDLIAAHALSLGVTLVTNNPADFAGIPGLSTQNWAAP